MSLLANLDVNEEVTAEGGDRLGGGGPLDTGVYPFNINLAYMGESSGGAMSLTLHLDSDGRELRQTIYLTSGKAKGGNPYYIDKKSGDKKWLPGYILGNHLALCTVGAELKTLDTEEKTVKLWNSAAGAEQNTQVQVVTALMNQKVLVAVWKQIVDKNVKNDAGDYVPSGETREENEIEKFFHAGTRMSVAEAKGGAETGVFIDQWADKFGGEVKDRSTKTSTGQVSPALGAAANAANAKPTESLFG